MDPSKSSPASIPRTTSDHTPLLTTIHTSLPQRSNFRFENTWLKNPGFIPTILPAWSTAVGTGDAASVLAACLKATRTAAKVWSKRTP